MIRKIRGRKLIVMKNMIRMIMWMAALTMVWGCSSDDNEGTAVFKSAQRPAWAIDWTYNDPVPSWDDPVSAQFECSMNVLVELDDQLRDFSTNADRMAIFISGQCRGVSLPNETPDGRVFYLLHVMGASEEEGHGMNLRFYCDSIHHLFAEDFILPFTPNNVMDETYQIVLNPLGKSSKYPLFTSLTVMLPDNLPFHVTKRDVMAVFVGDDCRGFLEPSDEYPGWRGQIYGRTANEQAHVRYFSAERGGVYICEKTFTLSNYMQQEEISF